MFSPVRVCWWTSIALIVIKTDSAWRKRQWKDRTLEVTSFRNVDEVCRISLPRSFTHTQQMAFRNTNNMRVHFHDMEHKFALSCEAYSYCRMQGSARCRRNGEISKVRYYLWYEAAWLPVYQENSRPLLCRLLLPGTTRVI